MKSITSHWSVYHFREARKQQFEKLRAVRIVRRIDWRLRGEAHTRLPNVLAAVESGKTSVVLLNPD